MGKAGQAFKQVLEEYDISQYNLSVTMNVERNNVYRRVNEKRDPSADSSSANSGTTRAAGAVAGS
jgi:plasmid maintenance system antidote protein VapI